MFTWIYFIENKPTDRRKYVFRIQYLRQIFFTVGFFGFYVLIQHCFTCRPSDSTVSEDAEIEPTTVGDFVFGSQTL
jgi:hypothetical protein